MGLQAADSLEGYMQIGLKGCMRSKYVTQERVHGRKGYTWGKVAS